MTISFFLNFALIYLSHSCHDKMDYQLCDSEKMSRQLRSITRIITPPELPEGDGASVRRIIGTNQLKNLDPFLMMDHFFVTKPAGFPDHPHRGFETVTYMLSGSCKHEDFKGNAGEISTGGVQWMTAGRGIIHAEMPGTDSMEGLQL